MTCFIIISYYVYNINNSEVKIQSGFKSGCVQVKNAIYSVYYLSKYTIKERF